MQHRLSEAAQVAERHTIPAESGLPLPTWPWYVKVQAAFLQGDLEKVLSSLRKRSHVCPCGYGVSKVVASAALRVAIPVCLAVTVSVDTRTVRLCVCKPQPGSAESACAVPRSPPT